MQTRDKLKTLINSTKPGTLLFSPWLTSQGYSPQLQKKYRDSGWLESLDRGVMYRPTDTLDAYAALASYNKQMGKHIRVAAHSALDYRGFRHYIPLGKPALTVALEHGEKPPSWMSSDKFDMTFRTFSTDIFPQQNIDKIENENDILYMTSPEQAIMECIQRAPRDYTYQDVFFLMELLNTLRTEILQPLLETCTSNRVKRVFLYMTDKANHWWNKNLDRSKIDTGKSKINLVPNGLYIPEYNMTVPYELEYPEG